MGQGGKSDAAALCGVWRWLSPMRGPHYNGLDRHCGRWAGDFGQAGSMPQRYPAKTREAGGAIPVYLLECLVEEAIDTGEQFDIRVYLIAAGQVGDGMGGNAGAENPVLLADRNKHEIDIRIFQHVRVKNTGGTPTKPNDVVTDLSMMGGSRQNSLETAVWLRVGNSQSGDALPPPVLQRHGLRSIP